MQKSVFTISMYVVAQQRSPEKCIFMSCTYICHGYTKGFVMSSNFRPMVLNPRCRNKLYIYFFTDHFQYDRHSIFPIKPEFDKFDCNLVLHILPDELLHKQFQFRNTSLVNLRNTASILLKIACIMHQFLVPTNFLGTNFLGI